MKKTIKIKLREITYPCPNPRCNKKRTSHTVQEARECLEIASADA